MSLYEWDINELMKKEEEFEKKAKFYSELTNIYRELISNYNLDLEGYKGHGEIYFEEKDEYTTYKQDVLDNINPTKLNILLGSINIFKNYSYQLSPIKYHPLNLTDKELVDFTMELIRTIPNKELITKIESFINPKDMLLHIKPSDELPTDAMGLTFIDIQKHKPYGLVSRTYTV